MNTPELELDNQLCFALYTASRALIRAYGPLLNDVGLTYPQYVTMLELWSSEAPLSVGDLGTRLHLDSGTLTPLLKRMQQLGLVDRNRDTGDERRVLISLTVRGAELKAGASSVPHKLGEILQLDPHAASKLRDQLQILTDRIENSVLSD